MAKGDFARLRDWAEDDGHEIHVTQPGSTNDGTWRVALDLAAPVKIHAFASSRDIDAAAEQVIAQLTTVGETVP